VFRNQGDNTFLELTARAGVSSLSLSRAGWANAIVDFNNDGRKDLFVAGGDVMDPSGEFREKVRQTNLVMANLGNFKFADATSAAGPEFSTKRATHRGAAASPKAAHVRPADDNSDDTKRWEKQPYRRSRLPR